MDNNTARYCIAKEYTRANGKPSWGVYDQQTRKFVEGGFFQRAAAQQAADQKNAEEVQQ